MDFLYNLFSYPQNKTISAWPINHPHWTENYVKVLLDDTTENYEKVLLDGTTTNKPNSTLEKIMRKSREFPIQFPKTTQTCEELMMIPSLGIDGLKKNIQSVYVIIHEHSLLLCVKFLLFKREHGTNIEKDLYKNMSVKDLIDRLLSKRAVAFMNSGDTYVLLDGTKGRGLWETIGKNVQPPLIMENCLSYDEIKLSALLSISSNSWFINDGNRKNRGDVQVDRSNIQSEGLIISLVGARLDKSEVMEYQEIVINQSQNQPEKVHGNEASLHKVFAEFYGEEIYSYDDERLTQDDRFIKLEDGSYFDTIAYAKRLSLSFDTLLIEANHRAKENTTSAYIHVVGIGLGAWKLTKHQTKIFMETFISRLNFLGAKLKNVSDVHFSYIPEANCISIKHGDLLSVEDHPNKGIKIYISNREPFTKLIDEHENKFLVVSYPGDGNALPGNQFWIGRLGGSGDSAAAASSQITELHNPHINELVCADNLRVATLSGAIVQFPEYVQHIRSESFYT